MQSYLEHQIYEIDLPRHIPTGAFHSFSQMPGILEYVGAGLPLTPLISHYTITLMVYYLAV